MRPVLPTDTQKIVPQALFQMYSEQTYAFDLAEGTVNNVANVRMIYLSSDIIRGIHQALVYETGEAWGEILKQCGYVWGKRMTASLEQQMKVLVRQKMDHLPIPQFVHLIEDFFPCHGWGVAKVDLSRASQHGVLSVSLTNSLFSEVLKKPDERVDFMIAGMLRGMFEIMSGHALDCIETISARDPSERVFVISSARRIDEVAEMIENGRKAEEVFDALCS